MLSVPDYQPLDLSTWLVSWWTDPLPSPTTRMRALLCKINQRDFIQMTVLRLDHCQISDTFTFFRRLFTKIRYGSFRAVFLVHSNAFNNTKGFCIWLKKCRKQVHVEYNGEYNKVLCELPGSAQKGRSALCPTFEKADFVETESHRPILSGYFFSFFFGRG